MSIIIGKGENRNLIFKVKPKDTSTLSQSDTLLFALKDNGGTVKKQVSKTISEITPVDNVYTFAVELDSAFTLSLDLGTYFYDLTLKDADNEKFALTKIKTIEIVQTVGASITST